MGDISLYLETLIVTDLKRDEGFRDKVYSCSAGKLTVGYGHNLESAEMPEHIAEALLFHDMKESAKLCANWEWFSELSDNRKRAIVNLVFNIGFNGVCKFKKMIAAIEQKNFGLAANEMIDSRWYSQVGDRAKRVVELMRAG